MLLLWAFYTLGTSAVHSIEFSSQQINVAMDDALTAIDQNTIKIEQNNGNSCPVPVRCPMAAVEHYRSRPPTVQSNEMALMAHVFEETTRYLMNGNVNAFETTTYGRAMTSETARALQSAPLSQSDMASTLTRCSNDVQVGSCNSNSKYRTADGSCNNLQNPSWGRAGSCMRRMLPSAYEDGISEPRGGKMNSRLPNPRRISTTLHPFQNVVHPDITHLVMHVGQFLDHDFALAPMELAPGGNPNVPIACCEATMRNTMQCFPIDIPTNDEFYAQFQQNCMNVIRSAPCTNCSMGTREQQDALTSYVDASQVYGSSANATLQLRTDDGEDIVNQYQLAVLSSGYTQYNPSVDATIMNEFAGAAFRLGHTLIDGVFQLWENFQGVGSRRLQDNFFFPFEYYNSNYLEWMLKGSLIQNAQLYDRFFTQDVTRHLFRFRNDSFGMDLVAINIQRGRDHGLRPYIDYLEYCQGQSIPKTWDYLASGNLISQTNINRLRSIYSDVSDIDLFSGGVSETPMAGAVIGPTFGCIVTEQFRRLKFGDRFYFEHGRQTGSFTTETVLRQASKKGVLYRFDVGQTPTTPFFLDQLREIRKTTMSSIICDNGENMDLIQVNAFRPVNNPSINPAVSCTALPRLNLQYWRESTGK